MQLQQIFSPHQQQVLHLPGGQAQAFLHTAISCSQVVGSMSLYFQGCLLLIEVMQLQQICAPHQQQVLHFPTGQAHAFLHTAISCSQVVGSMSLYFQGCLLLIEVMQLQQICAPHQQQVMHLPAGQAQASLHLQQCHALG